jgi:hypothetical protein
MANFETNLAAKTGLRGASGLIDPTLYQGSLRFLLATLTLDDGMTANDTFDIGPALPPGARVVPQLSKFTCHADPGTTLTIDIGDAGDADRYCDGAVLSAGGEVAFCSAAIPDAVANPVRFETATEILGVIKTASTITYAVKVDVLIAYLVG